MSGKSFPYYMIRSPLGFLFNHYEYRNSILLNVIIQQTLVEAGHKIDQQLAQNPVLGNQALHDKWSYIQVKHKYILSFVPHQRKLTYDDISTIIPLISTWATQYAGVQCDFDIWIPPGTSTQRKLGTEHLAHVAYVKSIGTTDNGMSQSLKRKFPSLTVIPPTIPAGTAPSTFPYHMTPENSLGLVFNNYNFSPEDNDVIKEALTEATQEYNQEVAETPTLANQTLDVSWEYEHNLHTFSSTQQIRR
ncbi:MAG: hypothetical protein Q9226_007561 [Calogaya cf. arnoldii]